MFTTILTSRQPIEGTQQFSDFPEAIFRYATVFGLPGSRFDRYTTISDCPDSSVWCTTTFGLPGSLFQAHDDVNDADDTADDDDEDDNDGGVEVDNVDVILMMVNDDR